MATLDRQLQYLPGGREPIADPGVDQLLQLGQVLVVDGGLQDGSQQQAKVKGLVVVLAVFKHDVTQGDLETVRLNYVARLTRNIILQ